MVYLQSEVQSLKARLAVGPAGPAGLSASSVDEIIAAAAAAKDNTAGSNNKAGAGGAAAGGGGGAPVGSGSAAVSSVEADTLAWIDALAQVSDMKSYIVSA